MTKFNSKFEGLLLTKAEMKSVKGGITCSTTYHMSDGSTMETEGGCSGNSISACNSYASSIAGSLIRNSGGAISSATSVCYQY